MDPSRITLRPFKLTDADDLLSWAGDDRVTKSGRWKSLTSKEEALTFIEQMCIHHPWRRSICIDDRSIGFLSVFPGSGDERHRADVGYAIAVEYWGQGITTAALKMGIPQVFDDFPQVLRLQAFTSVDNKASQRVLEKAGFTREGLLRKYICLKGSILDVVVFGLLSSDS
ncbi:hypothetical protein CDL12_14351 [Handroanthus impetiginosus]|uniref:N-acetyltransferase domain-containing protein n=1 Tax=Handroanthus impetiginosus TaxID=429701 RepID=A0A2G9H6U4_9LAMI|nr:hypothetical protein CDL12_14351 [Handroanthus impetiginosus]